MLGGVSWGGRCWERGREGILSPGGGGDTKVGVERGASPSADVRVSSAPRRTKLTMMTVMICDG